MKRFLAVFTVAFLVGGAAAFVNQPKEEELPLQWWCHDNWLGGHSCTSRLPPGCDADQYVSSYSHSGSGRAKDHDEQCSP